MRRVTPVVGMLLVYFLVPRAEEMTVDLVHAVLTGHTFHDESHHDEPPAEHGCSGPYHSCMCHSSLTFLPMQQRPAPVPRDVATTVTPPDAESMHGIHPVRELERPPAT